MPDDAVTRMLNEAVPLAQRVVGRELTSAERFAVVRRVREALGEDAPPATTAVPSTNGVPKMSSQLDLMVADVLEAAEPAREAIVGRGLTPAERRKLAKQVRESIAGTIAEKAPAGGTFTESAPDRSDFLREELGRLTEVGRRMLGRKLTTEEQLDLVQAIDATSGATPPSRPTAASLAETDGETFRALLGALPDAERPYGRARESAPADIPRPGAGAPPYAWEEYRSAVLADAADRSDRGPRSRRR